MVLVEYGEFKGNKIIKLKKTEADEYPFVFGLGKAKLIAEHIDEIIKFVEDNE